MSGKIIAQIRNEEASDLTEQINLLYKKSPLYGNAYLTKIFGELDPQYELLLKAVKFMKAESESEEFDEIRDEKVKAPFYLVRGALFNPDAEVQKAAERISKILEHHGLSMIDENYSTESTRINSLLEELDKPQLSDSVAAIQGLSELIADLRIAQDNFQTANLAFEAAKSTESAYNNATKVKRTLVKLINQKLVTFLEGMMVVDEETYGELAQAIRQIIADKNIIVRKRSKTGKEVAEETQN